MSVLLHSTDPALYVCFSLECIISLPQDQIKSCLRRCIDRFGSKNSGNGEQATAMAELLDNFKDAFAGQDREPLLTACSTPVQPGNDEMNIGLDAFFH